MTTLAPAKLPPGPRVAQPAFHRGRVENYAGTMVAYTERMLEGWRDGEHRESTVT